MVGPNLTESWIAAIAPSAVTIRKGGLQGKFKPRVKKSRHFRTRTKVKSHAAPQAAR
jgi:hypothetical protein